MTAKCSAITATLKPRIFMLNPPNQIGGELYGCSLGLSDRLTASLN